MSRGRRAIAHAIIGLSVLVCADSARAAELTVTAQAVAAHGEFLTQAPVPPIQGVLCLVDSGVDVNPDTEPILVGRESIHGGTTDDVTPYEQRKLTLLNGAHSLLAYTGSVRGHATIDEAMGDVVCRDRVEAFWDEACPHLTLPQNDLVDYRAALTDRFINPRVRHQLSQIAADGSIKLPVRIVPSLLAERAEGRRPIGGATAVAAWIWHLRGHGVPVKDPAAEAVRTAALGPDAVRDVLTTLNPRLGSDRDLVDLVSEQLELLDPDVDPTP
jgi:mannitol-1-phosphate/altronate dehydrogenase